MIKDIVYEVKSEVEQIQNNFKEAFERIETLASEIASIKAQLKIITDRLMEE